MERKTLNYKTTFAALIGNCLEWFDIALSVLLAPFISYLFLPVNSEFLQIVLPVIGTSIGLFVRPFGAIVFAYLGDKFGRKTPLILSIFLIILGSFVSAFLPTYAQVGITAAILFLCVIILNGFSFGAEMPLAISLLYESAPKKLRTFSCSLIYCGGFLGVLLASLDFSLFINNYTDSQSQHWRIPFIIAGIIGMFGFFLRKKIHESPLFLEVKHKHELTKFPLMPIFTKHIKNYVVCCVLAIAQAISLNCIFIISIPFHYRILHRPLRISILLSVACFAISFLTIPLFGMIGSKIGKLKVLIYSSIAFVIFVIPLVYMSNSPDYFLAFTGQILLGVLISSFLGVYPGTLSALFPTSVRCSGIALSHNVMVGIFSGTTAFFNAQLAYFHHLTIFGGIYMSAIFFIVLMMLLLTKKRLSHLLAE